MIIKKEDLLEIFKDIQLIPSNLKNIKDKSIFIEMDCQSFYNFCHEQGKKFVFFQYHYYNKDDYIITDDSIKNSTFSNKEYEFCKKWADKYNEIASKLDFERPIALFIATSIESEWVVSVKYDNWMSKDILIAEDALVKFQEDNKDLLESFSEEKDSDLFLIDELEEKLLNDKEFRYCTNHIMRYQYAKSFVAKKTNHKYLKLCADIKDEGNKIFKMSSIFDRIYTEYRNNCYALKIQVGNPLPKDD